MIDADSSPFLGVLAALEANGPQEFFERELEQASAAGLLSPEEGELLRRIDSNLVRGRRRESLLRVLLETTTDLVGITDFDAMLQAIVRRTRMLLGSDMAYISLNDYERLETFIHTTDGVATDAYRNIRMELGAGVLGKIASGTGSAQALDYIGDPDIVHVDEIDGAVQREGVRSIMGAPLLRDGVLLGALLVAERYQRRYTAEEVWLVESMSALACVALSNARLIGDLQGALAERDRFQDRLEVEKSRLAHEQSVERALVDAAVSSDPYGQFLEVLRDGQPEDLWILDQLGGVVRGTRATPIGEVELEKALRRAHLSDEFLVLTGGSGEALSLCAVGAASRLLGGILLGSGVSADRERLVRRSTVMLSVLRLMDESNREESEKAQTQLVHDLLRPDGSFQQRSVSRAARFGLTQGTAVYVHVLACESSPALVVGALREYTTVSGGAAAEFGGYAVALHSESIGERLVHSLTSRGIGATVGVKEVLHFSGSLGVAYQEASATLSAMLALGLQNQAASSKELGPVGMLMTSANASQVNSIISLELSPVIDYDAARGTQLMDTLWEYFVADMHQTAAAQALHIHPNTLRQRLDRVRSLLGEDWQAARRSSMLFLALQLHRLQGSRTL